MSDPGPSWPSCFVKVLIETNVNISNELNFSDGSQNVNYIGLLEKFTRTSSGFNHYVVYILITHRNMKLIP